MSEPLVEQIKQALLSGESGSGLNDIRVYIRPSRQYGQGFGDIICRLMPDIMRVAMTLITTYSESLNNGSSIGDSFKWALKQTFRTALKHNGKALGKVNKEQEKPTAVPPVGPPLLHQDERDAGTVSPPQSQTGAGKYKAAR